MLSKLSKQDKQLFCVNAIMNIAQKETIKILALASSIAQPEKQSAAAQLITDSMKQLNKKVLLLDMQSTSAEDIQNQLNQLQVSNDYDYVLVNLKPVKTTFSALQVAAKCQGTILLEKYTKTKHQAFDELLDLLKQNDIPVCGVVTF